MRISVPLNTNVVGAIQYPGTRTHWSNTSIDGDRIVGDYGGDLYAAGGTTKAFDWTEYTPPLRTDWKVTPLAFLNRFSSAEESALRTAAKQSVQLEALLDRVRVASYIDLKREDTRAAIEGFEQSGMIAPGRASAILDTPPTPEEVPTV